MKINIEESFALRSHLFSVTLKCKGRTQNAGRQAGRQIKVKKIYILKQKANVVTKQKKTHDWGHGRMGTRINSDQMTNGGNKQA